MFCTMVSLGSKLKTNCKCFSAAEPVCSPGIITVITVAVGAVELGLLGKLLKTHVRDFMFYENRDLKRCLGSGVTI